MPGEAASFKLAASHKRPEMGLFDFLKGRPSIATPMALSDFLDSRSAFLVQKCIYEYARARSGVLSTKLFKEPAFQAAMEASRWRNYPVCLQNVSVMVEHALRAEAGADAGAMREGLIAAAGDVCHRYPLPAGFEPDFWEKAHQRVARRVRLAGMAAPHAIKDLPLETAREFAEHMPVHRDVRQFDFELVTNNQRVNLCRIHEDFVAMADAPALAHALIADGADAEPALTAT